MVVSRPQIQLHIDELVMRGFEPQDRDPVVAGLRAELVRLLSDPASHAALGPSRAVSRLMVNRWPVAAPAGAPARTGQIAAQHIARGLTR